MGGESNLPAAVAANSLNKVEEDLLVTRHSVNCAAVKHQSNVRLPLVNFCWDVLECLLVFAALLDEDADRPSPGHEP